MPRHGKQLHQPVLEAKNSARPPDGSRVEVMLTMCSPLRDERRLTTERTAATSPASLQYRHSWLARRRRRSPAVSHAPPICMGSSSGRTRRWDRVSQVVTDSTPLAHSRGNPPFAGNGEQSGHRP